MSKKEYPAKLTTGYYRVREVWEDEASQLGAYRLLANARAKCDENPGSRVFDNDGNVIYPEEAVPVTGAEESEERPVLDEPEEKEAEELPKEDTPADKEEHTEEEKATVDEDEFPTAEELPATIAYGKLKTLMNIRKKPSLDAEVVAGYKKNTLVEVFQFCDQVCGSRGWRGVCAEQRRYLRFYCKQDLYGCSRRQPLADRGERTGGRKPLCRHPYSERTDFQRHPGRHETADPVTTK